jgi:hypothetical protein
MNDPEFNPHIPDIDIKLTVTHIKAKPRILKTKIVPLRMYCGQIMTMEGVQTVFKCKKYHYKDPPDKPWIFRMTGGNTGYFFWVCPRHKNKKLK